MPQVQTCPRGHEWAGDPAACPVCTAAPDSWDAGGASTFDSVPGDELPPPPSNSVRGPAVGRAGPKAPPAVPGYEVLGEVGRGGMGVVYKARHLRLNRVVALKVLSGGAHADPEGLSRFRAEAEAVAALQHPNIVQVFEVGEADGLPYFAMEFVDGGTLTHALAAAPLAARPAAELVEALARAVRHAHERGVVHRDLKPGNVLLVSRDAPAEREGSRSAGASRLTGSPKVSDFGLAKRLDGAGPHTLTGVVMGTPGYMAPEQAAGRTDVGPAADVYALGAILYECLTGRPPFRAASAAETFGQVLIDDPVPPGRLQPGLPRDLDTICLQCLRKEPDKRYASAAALADDLRRYLDGKPILARPVLPWERAAKWARRWPAGAGLIAVSLMAAVSLGVLGYRYLADLRRHNRELTNLNDRIARERDEKDAQRRRAEDNLTHAAEAIDSMLADMGLRRVAGIPHIDRARAALLESAVKLCAKLLTAQADSPKGRFLRAYLCWLSADLYRDLGRREEAAGRYGEALALAESLRGEAPAEVPPESTAKLQFGIHSGRGMLYLKAGEIDQARAEQEAATALTEPLLAANPADPDVRYAAAVGCVNLSIALQAAGDRRGQELHLARALRYSERLVGDHPDERAYAYIHAFVLNAQGAFCVETREPARAVPDLEKSVELWRRVLSEDPANLEYAAGLGRTLGNLSVAWREQGYVRRALEPAEESLKVRERLARDHPDVPEFAFELAVAYFGAGQLYLARRDPTAAAASYTRTIEKLGEPGPDPRRRNLLRQAYQARATVHRIFRRTPEAVADLGLAAGLAAGPDRAALRVEAAVLLATAGEPGRAAEAVEAALKEAAVSPENRFDASRALAVAAGKESAPEPAGTYAARAVGVLEGLAADGFFRDPERRKALDEQPDFKPLRGRADFDAVRARVRGQ